MPAMFMLGIAAVVLPLLGNCLEIDPVHRPDRYAADSTFHRTFLYELSWNLALAAFLVWLGRRRQIRGLFALYVAGCCGFRIVEELLRSDPAHHIFGLRLNFFVATVLCATGLAWFMRTQRPRRRRFSRTGPAALGLGWLIFALSGCGHGARTHAPVTEPGSKGSDVVVVSCGTADAPRGRHGRHVTRWASGAASGAAHS